MSISLIRKLALEEKAVKALFLDVLNLPDLKGKHWEITSPEVIEKVMILITETVGDPDPFAAEKKMLNNTLMEKYPSFKNLVESSNDPLYTAVNLAIAGNAIDFMVPEGTVNLGKTIQEQIETPLPYEWFSSFKEQLETSKLILYFGDNAGEIVLDKLLIETIRRRYDSEIIFVVRSEPTLNDVTLKDASAVGIDNVVTVFENGIKGPVPGTILKRCSSEIRDAVERADLIVSKGGGNYDSLGEEKQYLNKIIFMFLSKCFPYYRKFGVKLFHPILTGDLEIKFSESSVQKNPMSA
jgi:uncharacterized protein with ATP-grasp and redox domains